MSPSFDWHTDYGRLIKTLTTSKNRATGVTFAPNPQFYPDGPTETRTVRGTKLIVLSSGALGTPGILERSGIGRKDVLDAVGVKQRVDLPGVGENYHGSPGDSYGRSTHLADCWTCLDHNIMFAPYFAADEAQTLDAIYGNDENAIAGVFPFTINRDSCG